MQRINTASRVDDLFGVGKHGWKSKIDPGGVTFGEKAFTNAVQEEIARRCELHVTLALGDSRNAMLADLEECRQAYEALTAATDSAFDISGTVGFGVAQSKEDFFIEIQSASPVWRRWTSALETFTPFSATLVSGDLVLGAVPATNGDLVLVGNDTSTDHKSWVWPAAGTAPSASTPISGGKFNSLATDGAGKYVTHSDTLTTVYNSTDGLVWSAVASPVAANSKVSFAGGVFCVSSTTAFYTSADGGATWSVKTHPNSGTVYTLGASVGGVHYFTTGGSASVYFTTDFTSWTEFSVSSHSEMQQFGAIGILYDTLEIVFITENAGNIRRPRMYQAGASSSAVSANRSFRWEASTVSFYGTYF